MQMFSALSFIEYLGNIRKVFEIYSMQLDAYHLMIICGKVITLLDFDENHNQMHSQHFFYPSWLFWEMESGSLEFMVITQSMQAYNENYWNRG